MIFRLKEIVGGVSKAQRGVYSSLERDGLIDNNGVTDKGYDYLET